MTHLDDDVLEARQTLIEHNLRLVVYIAKKFDNTGVGVEDLISIGTIGLIKAINTFKSDKNIKLASRASFIIICFFVLSIYPSNVGTRNAIFRLMHRSEHAPCFFSAGFSAMIF